MNMLPETNESSGQRGNKARPSRRLGTMKNHFRTSEPDELLLRLPNRAYQVYAGTLNDLLALSDQSVPGSPLRPNLWRPTDGSWIIVTDIDLVETFVGGPDAFVDGAITDGELRATHVESNESIGL